MPKNIQQIKKYGDRILSKTFKKLASEDVTFLMPAFYPQRGGVLAELVKNGGKAIIAGGAKGQQIFKEIPQYGIEGGTTGIEESIEKLTQIVKAYPEDIMGDVAVFSEAPLGNNAWSNAVKNHLPNVNIIGTNEQNLRLYFEEKVNLTSILEKAGLSKHIIPSEVVQFPQSIDELTELYKTLSSEDGRVVIQSCGPGVNESGGGYSTNIVSSFEDFINVCSSTEAGKFAKIATYIQGYNSNLSICVGNTVADKNGLGATKQNLDITESLYHPSTLDSLVSRSKDLGIDESNIFTIVAPATLKVVGDKNLTHSSTNGVGNMINHHFEEDISNQIYDIGSKLGHLLGLCGKVGLAGVDLIVTKEGNIFINEINDRQQGPTEKTSIHCENNDIPGIHHISFLQNYADLNDVETKMYMTWLKENQKEIYQASVQTSSPFYIKMVGKMPAVSDVNLSSGMYYASRDEQGSWTWDLENPLPTETQSSIDFDKGEIVVGLTDVGLSCGQAVPKGTQIARIIGETTDDESAPFLIDSERGVSVLNDKWVGVVSSLYKQALSPFINQEQATSSSLSSTAGVEYGTN